jgi:hypothetical protein
LPDSLLLAKLRLSCAKLLDRMLASNDDETQFLAGECDKILDVPRLFHLMRLYFCELPSDPYPADTRGHRDASRTSARVQQPPGSIGTRKTSFRNNWKCENLGEITAVEIGFLHYTVVKRLHDFTNKVYHLEPLVLALDTYAAGEYRCANPIAAAYAKIEGRTASIELLMDGRIQRVHFFVKASWVAQLQESVRSELLWSVNRDSLSEQVRDFVDRSQVIVADMKFREGRCTLLEPLSSASWPCLWQRADFPLGCTFLSIIAGVSVECTQCTLLD